jgi:hypothetical protein
MSFNNKLISRWLNGTNSRATQWMLVAAIWTIAAGSAGAVGLVYVDAINDDDSLTGTFGPNANLAPQAAFSVGFTPDNFWGYRSAIGAESPTFSRYIWEAGGTTAGSNVEDAPEITQTIGGLTPSASYDVYVAYWSSNGANWGVRAGFATGIYQLFDRTGTGGAVAGTAAGAAIWNLPPTSSSLPFYTEADRTMYLGKVGTASANAQGRVSVFLNDRPNTTDADRTWLDGLAYAPAGTGITLTATVNRATGNLSIVNNTGEALHFTSYSVTSANSALKPAGWLSIQDNYVGGGAGKLDTDAWTVTAPPLPYPTFAGTLSEAESGFDGATLANGGGTFNLGNLWARSPFEDAQVQFMLTNGSTLTLTPQFTGTAVANGDFNTDGNLNLADYLNLRDHMHMDLTALALTRIENYGMGDLTGDALVNFQDFSAFRTSYIQINGPGAFAVFNLPAYGWMLSAHDRRVHNVRRFTRGQAHALLRHHGFRVLRSSYWNTLLFPLMLLHRLVERADADSDVRDYPRWLDALFAAALAVERAAISAGLGLPFGGSLIVVAARDD